MDYTEFFYGIVAGLIPSFLWLWFWIKENNLHPEPRAILTKCFIYGMLAVFVAILFQWWTASIFSDNLHRYIIWAAIEEVLKFAAAFFAAFWIGAMDEPIDAMIFMISAALGFAAVENVMFMLGAIGSGSILSVVIIGNMRFIGATLVHVVSSSMVGFMIAISFYSSRFVKVIATTVGLLLATALHSAFNLSIINATTADTLKIFAGVWVGVVLLILIFEEIKGIELKEDAKHGRVIGQNVAKRI